MYGAPPSLRRRLVVHRTIPDGDAGILETLRAMSDLTLQDAADPLIQETSTRILGETGGPLELRAWLDARFRFADDPPSHELVRSPRTQLLDLEERGWIEGDCDDAAVLAAALGIAAGYRARWVVVALGWRPYEHVWTELQEPGGPWIELDVTRPRELPPGTRIHRQRRMMVWPT